jgi:hypothetical protein
LRPISPQDLDNENVERLAKNVGFRNNLMPTDMETQSLHIKGR